MFYVLYSFICECSYQLFLPIFNSHFHSFCLHVFFLFSEVRPFVYFVSYQPSKDASFMPVLGMNYPGMIIGNAITFNPYGIAYTQNALTPQHSRVSGLASNFIQRLCVEKRSFDECMTVLAMAGQTMGYSLNVVSAREGLACNVEVMSIHIYIYFLSIELSISMR